MTLALSLVAALTLSAAKPATARAKLHKKAVKSFENAEFERAAMLFRDELRTLPEEERGGPNERDARKYLVLSLYNSEQHEAARIEYRMLVDHFANFHFDPNEVLPETVAFFEGPAPRQAAEETPPAATAELDSPPSSEPAIAPSPLVAAPSGAPVIVQPAPTAPAPRRWHWYYLAPLGIGQYLAGSPGRGTFFLLTELGLLATNITMGFLLGAQRMPDGTVRDLGAATAYQAMLNVSAWGLIAAGIAGVIDGAAFEP